MREDTVKSATAWADRAALGEVEISFGVVFESELEFVEVCGEENVVVEDLELVSFTVFVDVGEFPDGITSGDIGNVLQDAKTQRLVESGGVTLPGDFLKFLQSRGEPNVTIPGAEQCAISVGEEVNITHANLTVVRRLEEDFWEGNVIDKPGGLAFGGLEVVGEALG